jgi:hypothetical protein
MKKFLAISAFALFSMMVAGAAMAQQNQVVGDSYTEPGAPVKEGTGAKGGADDAFMRQLLVKPETIYGRLWGKDLPGGKIYVETGGGALVTVRLNEKTNMDNFKAVGVGNDVEVQAYRNMKRLGTGAFAADIPDGDAYALDITVLRKADNPTNLVPQAGYNPDTDRAIYSKDSSVLGGVGGQCWQCYPPESGYGTDYGKGTTPASGGAAPKK